MSGGALDRALSWRALSCTMEMAWCPYCTGAVPIRPHGRPWSPYARLNVPIQTHGAHNAPQYGERIADGAESKSLLAIGLIAYGNVCQAILSAIICVVPPSASTGRRASARRGFTAHAARARLIVAASQTKQRQFGCTKSWKCIIYRGSGES